MVISVLLAGLVAASTMGTGEEEKPRSRSPYVVLVDDASGSVEALFDRYPELSASFEELAKFNLLRAGRPIEIPKDMLSSNKVLAKVGSFFGEAEVKRSFDGRYVPLVPDLLLREGDELRTWRGAGVRILFEDGNYVFLKSQSRAKLVGLGNKQSPTTSRLQVELEEGGIWSQIENTAQGRYEIRTATASTIIRGTEFRVKVEAGDVTRLEVLDGEVELEVGTNQLWVAAQHGALASSTNEAPTSVPLPPAPELMAPLTEEVIRGERFDQVFRWGRLPEAAAYVLEVSRDAAFFDIVLERRVGPEATTRILGLEPGTYFWRVSAIDTTGFEGSPSQSRYFVRVERQP